MYCSHCGNQNAEGAAFCSVCGTALSESPVKSRERIRAIVRSNAFLSTAVLYTIGEGIFLVSVLISIYSFFAALATTDNLEEIPFFRVQIPLFGAPFGGILSVFLLVILWTLYASAKKQTFVTKRPWQWTALFVASVLRAVWAGQEIPTGLMTVALAPEFVRDMGVDPIFGLRLSPGMTAPLIYGAVVLLLLSTVAECICSIFLAKAFWQVRKQFNDGTVRSRGFLPAGVFHIFSGVLVLVENITLFFVAPDWIFDTGLHWIGTAAALLAHAGFALLLFRANAAAKAPQHD